VHEACTETVVPSDVTELQPLGYVCDWLWPVHPAEDAYVVTTTELPEQEYLWTGRRQFRVRACAEERKRASCREGNLRVRLGDLSRAEGVARRGNGDVDKRRARAPAGALILQDLDLLRDVSNKIPWSEARRSGAQSMTLESCYNQ